MEEVKAFHNIDNYITTKSKHYIDSCNYSCYETEKTILEEDKINQHYYQYIGVLIKIQRIAKGFIYRLRAKENTYLMDIIQKKFNYLELLFVKNSITKLFNNLMKIKKKTITFRNKYYSLSLCLIYKNSFDNCYYNCSSKINLVLNNLLSKINSNNLLNKNNFQIRKKSVKTSYTITKSIYSSVYKNKSYIIQKKLRFYIKNSNDIISNKIQYLKNKNIVKGTNYTKESNFKYNNINEAIKIFKSKSKISSNKEIKIKFILNAFCITKSLIYKDVYNCSTLINKFACKLIKNKDKNIIIRNKKNIINSATLNKYSINTNINKFCKCLEEVYINYSKLKLKKINFYKYKKICISKVYYKSSVLNYNLKHKAAAKYIKDYFNNYKYKTKNIYCKNILIKSCIISKKIFYKTNISKINLIKNTYSLFIETNRLNSKNYNNNCIKKPVLPNTKSIIFKEYKQNKFDLNDKVNKILNLYKNYKLLNINLNFKVRKAQKNTNSTLTKSVSNSLLNEKIKLISKCLYTYISFKNKKTRNNIIYKKICNNIKFNSYFSKTSLIKHPYKKFITYLNDIKSNNNKLLINNDSKMLIKKVKSLNLKKTYKLKLSKLNINTINKPKPINSLNINKITYNYNISQCNYSAKHIQRNYKLYKNFKQKNNKIRNYKAYTSLNSNTFKKVNNSKIEFDKVAFLLFKIKQYLNNKQNILLNKIKDKNCVNSIIIYKISKALMYTHFSNKFKTEYNKFKNIKLSNNSLIEVINDDMFNDNKYIKINKINSLLINKENKVKINVNDNFKNLLKLPNRNNSNCLLLKKTLINTNKINYVYANKIQSNFKMKFKSISKIFIKNKIILKSFAISKIITNSVIYDKNINKINESLKNYFNNKKYYNFEIRMYKRINPDTYNKIHINKECLKKINIIDLALHNYLNKKISQIDNTNNNTQIAYAKANNKYNNYNCTFSKFSKNIKFISNINLIKRSYTKLNNKKKIALKLDNKINPILINKFILLNTNINKYNSNLNIIKKPRSKHLNSYIVNKNIKLNKDSYLTKKINIIVKLLKKEINPKDNFYKEIIRFKYIQKNLSTFNKQTIDNNYYNFTKKIFNLYISKKYLKLNKNSNLFTPKLNKCAYTKSYKLNNNILHYNNKLIRFNNSKYQTKSFYLLTKKISYNKDSLKKLLFIINYIKNYKNYKKQKIREKYKLKNNNCFIMYKSVKTNKYKLNVLLEYLKYYSNNKLNININNIDKSSNKKTIRNKYLLLNFNNNLFFKNCYDKYYNNKSKVLTNCLRIYRTYLNTTAEAKLIINKTQPLKINKISKLFATLNIINKVNPKFNYNCKNNNIISCIFKKTTLNSSTNNIATFIHKAFNNYILNKDKSYNSKNLKIRNFKKNMLIILTKKTIINNNKKLKIIANAYNLFKDNLIKIPKLNKKVIVSSYNIQKITFTNRNNLLDYLIKYLRSYLINKKQNITKFRKNINKSLVIKSTIFTKKIKANIDFVSLQSALRYKINNYFINYSKIRKSLYLNSYICYKNTKCNKDTAINSSNMIKKKMMIYYNNKKNKEIKQIKEHKLLKSSSIIFKYSYDNNFNRNLKLLCKFYKLFKIENYCSKLNKEYNMLLTKLNNKKPLIICSNQTNNLDVKTFIKPKLDNKIINIRDKYLIKPDIITKYKIFNIYFYYILFIISTLRRNLSIRKTAKLNYLSILKQQPIRINKTNNLFIASNKDKKVKHNNIYNKLVVESLVYTKKSKSLLYELIAYKLCLLIKRKRLLIKNYNYNILAKESFKANNKDTFNAYNSDEDEIIDDNPPVSLPFKKENLLNNKFKVESDSSIDEVIDDDDLLINKLSTVKREVVDFNTPSIVVPEQKKLKVNLTLKKIDKSSRLGDSNCIANELNSLDELSVASSIKSNIKFNNLIPNPKNKSLAFSMINDYSTNKSQRNKINYNNSIDSNASINVKKLKTSISFIANNNGEKTKSVIKLPNLPISKASSKGKIYIRYDEKNVDV